MREDSARGQALLVFSLQASVILRASSVAHQPDSTPDPEMSACFSEQGMPEVKLGEP